MTSEKFFLAIRLERNAAETVLKNSEKIPSVFLDYYFFIKNTQGYFEKLESFCDAGGLNKYEVMLSVCCSLSISAHKFYIAAGISDDVYFDTFKDISIWSNSFFRRFGYWGLQEYLWLQHHIGLKLFRLGRLQFLPQACGKVYMLPQKTVMPEDIVLSVHIPEDGRLEYCDCIKSYEAAAKFFRVSRVYMCESWLLNDKLKLFLSPNSNIIKFQNDFTLFEEDISCRQAEERVFFKLCDNYALYPEETSLQKGLKQYLLSGNKMGTKTGLFFR